MMKKKKKHSRSQSSIKKTSEPSQDSSPSPRLLSLFRSKLGSGKDLKHMLGMRSKTIPGLSSQSRIVRCPKCQKLLQEPIDATCYKCGGCDSILQAKRWELQGNDNTIPVALLSSENRSLSIGAEFAEGGSKTPMRNTHREDNSRALHTHQEYNSRASPSVERGYHSESVNKHKTPDIRREWMRRADEFSVANDPDVYASARSSPYSSSSHVSEWTQHEGRYQHPPRVPYYPASPSPSSAYEYGYSSPFHGSQVSASEQSYYHQQPNQLRQYGREGSFQESSVASPLRYTGETSDGKYYPCSSQSQLHDLQNHNLYEDNSSPTPQRSVYSERSYQAAAAPHRYAYSEHYMGFSKSETSSEKSSGRDKNRYVREKNPVVKRHILPSAGGAPFATCSYCLELLELPQVSLGTHKRYQVRCGSCSGVFKLSTQDKADTVLSSPSFADSAMDFVDETVTIHQDDQASGSEGHKESYPDETPLSCSDNDFGDTICKSTNDVIFSRSLKTYEAKHSISSEILDSRLKALQPQLKPSVNHRFQEQNPASTEIIREASRTHLEQSQEVHSERLIEMDKKISERVRYDIEESGYEKNEILKSEEMVGDGSGQSLEVTVHKNKKMSQSSEEVETVAERLVSQSVEPLKKNESVCETSVPSANIRDTQEFDWKEIRESEEYGGETTLKEITGDKQGFHLEKSQYTGVSIYDSILSNREEDIEYMSATPQSSLKPLVNKNQEFTTHPDHSGEATVTTSRVHEEHTQDSKPEQSQGKYENLSERQDLEKIINDRVGYELEKSRYETNEILEPGKFGDNESGVSLAKASETFKTIKEDETGEERFVSHQVDNPKEKVENSYEILEPLYLQGSGYAGERAWSETIEDRAGLHLEEYERNYANHSTPFEWTSERAPMFHTHDYELGEILEPEEGADGRSESCSRGSFNDHESSEAKAEFQESEDAKPEQSWDKYENSSKRQELSSTGFDIVRSELQEFRYETNETLEPGKMVGVGSVVSPEKISETTKGERGEETLVSHQMEPENKNVEVSYGTVEPVYLEGSGAGLQLEKYQSNPCEWTSERAPTFRLHDYDQGTMLEPDKDADGRSESSSRSSFNDHESSKEIAVLKDEQPWLMNDSKTDALQIRDMEEEGQSLHLEKCENETIKLDEKFEWTSERALTFRLHEYEPRTMPERNEDADGISEPSSKGSSSDHKSSKERVINHEEELLPVDNYETKAQKVGITAEDRQPREDIFRLCPDDTLEEEKMMFHLEMPQEKQENLRQTSKQDNTEEDIPESPESPSTMPELDSESEEELLEDHLEHLQKENENSGLTSEPYPHIHSTTEPSEIVGLRHALYQTQSSPLRSPLTSPIHTPIGSPLHYLIGTQIRSPITSPIHPHIVSPLRSPIHSSGSLSDVLFFGKKA